MICVLAAPDIPTPADGPAPPIDDLVAPEVPVEALGKLDFGVAVLSVA